MSGNRSVRSIATVAAAGLAFSLATGSALAQHALGDGQALDRNLQRGSAGKNSKVRDIKAEIQFQNAIITGNAPGGKSFHGDVGYLAADEVRANLGSNDLFNYYRDSSASVLPSVGIRGTDALRYQYALATGSAPPAGLAGGFTMSRSQAGTTGGQVGGLRSTADYLARREARQTIISYRPAGDEGGGVAVTASPLLGIREVTLSATQILGTTDRNAPSPPNVTPPPGSPLTTPGIPGDPKPKPAGWQFTGMEAVPRGVERPRLRATEIDTSAPTDRLDAVSTKAHDQVLTRFKDELAQFGPKPAEKPDEAKPGDTKPGELDKPKTGEGADASARDPLGEWRAKLDEMRSALRPDARPKPKKPTDSTKPAEKPLTDEQARDIRAEKELEEARKNFLKRTLDEEALKALKKTKPKIDDLGAQPAGAVSLAYAGHMAAGQVALADGRYFDAEEAFSRALGAIGGDPMAQVGRVHAQVASGLYMSGAVNLRNLLTSHPELVGVRYGDKLLPTRDRWAAIAQQLNARLGGEEAATADAAGLLLAYMGYQFGDQQAVSDGLAEMGKHVGEDAASKNLLQVIKAVWTETPETDTNK